MFIKNFFCCKSLALKIAKYLQINEYRAEKLLKYCYWYELFKSENNKIPTKSSWNKFAKEKNKSITEFQRRCPTASGCNDRFKTWNQFIVFMESILFNNIIMLDKKMEIHRTKKPKSNSIQNDIEKLNKQMLTVHGRELSPEDWRKALGLDQKNGLIN